MRCRLLTTVLCALALGASPAAAAVPSGNLLQDPGGEAAGSCSGDGGTVVPIPAWTASASFTVACYGGSALPGTDVSSSIGGGSNLFYGGSDPTTSATQLVDVSAAATDIDSGSVQAALSGYVGGFSNQNDNMVVAASFLDATGTALGTDVRIGPVTAADRGDVTTLLYRSATGAVPAGTRAIRVTMTATRTDGSYNDASADNLSLALEGATASQHALHVEFGVFGAGAPGAGLFFTPGTVTSDPAGLSCALASCDGSFATGTKVTLTTVAAPGAAFATWAGAGCAGTSSCAVAVDADHTVIADIAQWGADCAPKSALQASVYRPGGWTLVTPTVSTPVGGPWLAADHDTWLASLADRSAKAALGTSGARAAALPASGSLPPAPGTWTGAGSLTVQVACGSQDDGLLDYAFRDQNPPNFDAGAAYADSAGQLRYWVTYRRARVAKEDRSACAAAEAQAIATQQRGLSCRVTYVLEYQYRKVMMPAPVKVQPVATVAGASASLSLTCVSSHTCTGQSTLTLLSARARSAAARSKLVLGRGHFKIPGRHKSRVRIRLDRAGLRRVHRTHVLRAQLSIDLRGIPASRSTIYDVELKTK